MRAAVRKGFFSSVLSFTTTQEEPAFLSSSNEIKIKVHAAGINPVDYKLPKVLGGPVYGIDFSGVIEEVGSDVSDDLNVGDEVFGGTQGSLADYCVSKESAVAKKNKSFTHAEAAALPVGYLTALQGLRNIGKVKENSSVLVIGASGGCGLAAIQLSKAMGCQRIIGICSAKNAQFVKGEGATDVVDYANADELETFFKENVGKIDCVFDSATGSGGGEDYTAMSLPLLVEDTGEYVQLNGPASVWIRFLLPGLQLPNKHQHLIVTDKNTADLEEILMLLEKINAKPQVNVMPFTERGVQDGFQLLMSRRARGKIVFDVASTQS